MQRVPEPDTVMDTDPSVEAFDAAGLPGGPLYPIYLFNGIRLSALLPPNALVVDLACGPGQFLAHLLTGREDLRGVGIDLSQPMLDVAAAHWGELGLGERVRLVRGDVRETPVLIAERVAAVVCMSALHQCPDRETLCGVLEAVRELRERDGCAVWLFDLVRPEDEKLVSLIPRSHEMFSGRRLTPAFKQDWMNSLRAGWTFAELSEALRECGLEALGIEANNSQLHVLPPAERLDPLDQPPWLGADLDATERKLLSGLADAFSAAGLDEPDRLLP